MRIEAEFFISHGDEARRMGLVMYRCGDVDASLAGLRWAIERMAEDLIAGALLGQHEGSIGESAHLVTDPADRDSRL